MAGDPRVRPGDKSLAMTVELDASNDAYVDVRPYTRRTFQNSGLLHGNTP